MSIATNQHDEEPSNDDKCEISNENTIYLPLVHQSPSTQTSSHHESATEDSYDEEEDIDEIEYFSEDRDCDGIQREGGTQTSVLSRDVATEYFVPLDPNCDPSRRRARLVIERLDNRQLIELLGPVRSRTISSDTILPMRMQT